MPLLNLIVKLNRSICLGQMNAICPQQAYTTRNTRQHVLVYRFPLRRLGVSKVIVTTARAAAILKLSLYFRLCTLGFNNYIRIWLSSVEAANFLQICELYITHFHGYLIYLLNIIKYLAKTNLKSCIWFRAIVCRVSSINRVFLYFLFCNTYRLL